MDYEENYVTYVDDEGCCDAVTAKLRKKRHFIVITLLLILAMVSILAGLFNGFTLKKYSDLALIIGIFFPSIILVFICVYLAFICGRESFRSSMMSRIHHLSGRSHSHPNQDVQENHQADSATPNNLRTRYQSKSMEAIDYPLEAKIVKQNSDKIDYNAGENYCEAKVSNKHFRSFSNPNTSKRTHGNLDKTEICKFSSRAAHDIEYSPRFRRHQDVNQRKEFKRSTSDPPNRNRCEKYREDRYTWNTQSLVKLKRNAAEVNVLNNAIGRNDFKSNEVVKKPPENFHRQKNRKSTEKRDKSTRFKEYDDYDQRHKSKRQEWVNVGHVRDSNKENCYSKSEMHLYSSSAAKPYDEYKQSLRFSSFRPERNVIQDIGGMTSCSSGDETGSTFSRSDCDTLQMERKINRRANFPSERDAYRLRRKTMHFPSTCNEESTRPSREYAHEYCKCTEKKKMIRQPFRRDGEKLEEHQKGKQMVISLAVNEWIENNEENLFKK